MNIRTYNNRFIVFLVTLILIATNTLFGQWAQTTSLPPTVNQATSLARIGSNIFVGTRFLTGVFISTNRGESWSAANTGLGGMWNIHALYAHGSLLFAGQMGSSSTGGGGVFLSTNLGNGWIESSSGLPRPLQSAYALAGNSTHVFVAYNAGVYMSSDSGSSWILIRPGPATSVAVIGNVLLAANNFGRTFRSTNLGASWDTVGSPLAEHHITCFGVFNSILFAGGDGIFRSTDLGFTWSQATTGMTSTAIHGFYAYEATFFAATYDGVFRTRDSGDAWTPVNEGLMTLFINALVSDSTYLYAATSDVHQVWRRPLSELVSVNESIPHGNLAEFHLAQNYPNPFNPTTNIEFQIPRRELVTLRVFDLLGREVETLVNEVMEPGRYERVFNAEGLASGVYLYQLRSGSFVQTRKLLLLR